MSKIIKNHHFMGSLKSLHSATKKKKYYTIQEFRRMFHIKQTHFYLLRDRDDLPQLLKMGGRCLISDSALDAWEKAHTYNSKDYKAKTGVTYSEEERAEKLKRALEKKQEEKERRARIRLAPKINITKPKKPGRPKDNHISEESLAILDKTIDAFNDFWDLYPVRENKKDCRKFFYVLANLNENIPEIIIEYLEKDIAANRKGKKGDLPHPLSWLLSYDWEVELAKIQKSDTI